jgi:SAM-dependent methyltransferase
MDSPPLDDFADCYEAMIDWSKRLAHEAPFYRRLFESVSAERVLDTACGTGHHAALFHSWGLRVEGADISESMLARARKNCGEPVGLQWTRRGYSDPIGSAGLFDVVLCVGNSLALAPDLQTARAAVTRMFDAALSGGAIVLQVLNLWRLADGPCQWQKCVRTELDQVPAVILKGVHRHGSAGYVDLVVSWLADKPAWRSESVPFLGFEATTLQQWAQAAGAGTVEVYGGYQSEPYQRETSADLIVVARKSRRASD